MIDNIAISVKNITKTYKLYDTHADRVKEAFHPLRKKYHRPFNALTDVSFDVNKGETLGIIGRNGSGKSTLLQIICGILQPTSGSVEVNGRVSALLELGAGFNPEFTGRQNVYINGSILGLTHEEIEARFDEIAAFADIGKYIDQPVKSYSSGMVVRLAFAVIVHVNADILVIDEALAVGDVFFSQKCMRFLEAFKAAGGTLLFVSHDTAAVMKLCNRAILLSKGLLIQQDLSDIVCKTYIEQLYAERSPGESKPLTSLNDTEDTTRHKPDSETIEFSVQEQTPNRIFVSEFNESSPEMGLGGAKIWDAGYFDENGKRLTELYSEARAVFSIMLTIYTRITYPAVGLVLKNRLGQAVFTEGTTWAFKEHYGENKLEFLPGDVVQVNFNHVVPILFEGEYSMTVAVAEGYGHDHVQHHLIHEAIILHSVGSRILHGISGFEGLKTVIQISRNNATYDNYCAFSKEATNE
jgi:homopolymeric O-antigen transport system ATP-binding protein